MATLQKIRNRAGLLISIIIGLALLAFVLNDLFSGRSRPSLFSNAQYEIAEISGRSIPQKDYLVKVDNMASVYRFTLGRNNLNEAFMDNIRADVWEKMVQDYVMEKQYRELGLAVSSDELFDKFQGSNPHPLIRQFFSDRETGQLNRSQLFRFLQETQDDEYVEEKRFRIYLENEIMRYTIFLKYNNLLSKGLNTTTLEAKRMANESNRTVNFDYVAQGFASVPDSVIVIKEKDIEDYYKKHKTDFEQDESRDIIYVYFEVVPSEDDYRTAEMEINEIKPKFVEAKDVRQFVEYNSDLGYDDINYSYDSLSALLRDSLFNAEVGTVCGPYFEDGAYKLARLAEINYLPDSVRARQIFLPRSQRNAMQVISLADSLKNLVVEKKADFAELAMANSADGSAKEGGDMGWFTEAEMVYLKSLRDSCFFGHKGDIKLITTPYGYHVVEILEQSPRVKKVQIGMVVKKVRISEETDRGYYMMASEFAGENNTYDKFNAALEKQDLMPHFARNLGPLEKNITGLDSPRALVKWAYDNNEHSVSRVFRLGNKLVIAAIDKVRNKGYAPVEDVRAGIEVEVMKEKKAERMIDNMSGKLKDARSMEELANILNTGVQTATNIRFASRSIGAAGIEPNVIATALALDADIISDPVAGNNGVYIVSVTDINEAQEPAYADLRRQMQFMQRNYTTRVYYSAYEVLKDMAKIKDLRTKFF
jgi:peptidyl-prolyl cis-trans isomerase D